MGQDCLGLSLRQWPFFPNTGVTNRAYIVFSATNQGANTSSHFLVTFKHQIEQSIGRLCLNRLAFTLKKVGILQLLASPPTPVTSSFSLLAAAESVCGVVVSGPEKGTTRRVHSFARPNVRRRDAI
jgi:hypothetical protein